MPLPLRRRSRLCLSLARAHCGRMASSASQLASERTVTCASVCLLLDARLQVGECGPTPSTGSGASLAAAAAVWRDLLPFVRCQALLALLTAQRSDWCVAAIHDSGDTEWLVRQPLSVGSVREMAQRCRQPLSPPLHTPPASLLPLPPPAPPSVHPSSLALPQPQPSAVNPVLVALKDVLQRQCEPLLAHGRSVLPPPSAASGSAAASRPCHVVLLSPHLFSACFVRDAALFARSLSTLGGSHGFSFRLLHLRCDRSDQLAPSMPLLAPLHGAPFIRGSARTDCLTSSRCQQPQQIWSVAASLPPIEPVHATLLIGAPQSLSRAGSHWPDHWVADAELTPWHDAFDDQSNAAVGEQEARDGRCMLTIPVLLSSATRQLPLPADTQVSSTAHRRSHKGSTVSAHSPLFASVSSGEKLCSQVGCQAPLWPADTYRHCSRLGQRGQHSGQSSSSRSPSRRELLLC